MSYEECSNMTLIATLYSIRRSIAAYGPLDRLVAIERAVTDELDRRGIAI
jgi:hypothetical protein